MSRSKTAARRLAAVALIAPTLALAPARDAKTPAQGAKTAAQTASTKDAKPGDAAATLARLVPSDAVCVVKVPSLDEFDASVRAFMAAVKPEAKGAFTAETLLKSVAPIPGAFEHLDHKKPIAVCLSVDGERMEPTPTFILPVTNADEFLKSLPPSPTTAAPVKLGDYVGVSMLAKYSARETPASLVDNMLPGAVSARVDLERVFEMFRPMIEPELDQIEEHADDMPAGTLPGVNAGELAHAYIDGFRTFMDSAQTLDLSTGMSGARYDLSFVFTALEKSALADFGSKEKSGIDRIARHIDPESGVAFVMGMDPQSMFKRFGPMFEHLIASYPEGMRPMFAASLASWGKLAPVMGTAACVNMDFSTTGLRGTTYFRPSDAKAWSDGYAGSIKALAMPGFEVRGPETLTVDGVAVTQFTLEVHDEAIEAILRKKVGDKVDDAQLAPAKAMLKRFYGEKGLRFAFATKGNDAVQVVGGDDAHLKRALAGLGEGDKKLAPDLQHEVDGVAGANPCFVARVDLARIMGSFMDAFSGIAGMPFTAPKDLAGAHAPVMFRGAVDGRVWRGGTSCDLAQIVTTMTKMFEQTKSAGESKGKSAGRSAKVKADILAIRAALDEYALNNGGKYPGALEVLVAPDSDGHTYLATKAVPRDPWGNAYHYEPAGPAHPKGNVTCYGADGKPGGEGEDADIDESALEAMRPHNVEKANAKK
jgi:general secretion pathway protein G